jgi:hypothetical protein
MRYVFGLVGREQCMSTRGRRNESKKTHILTFLILNTANKYDLVAILMSSCSYKRRFFCGVQVGPQRLGFWWVRAMNDNSSHLLSGAFE